MSHSSAAKYLSKGLQEQGDCVTNLCWDVAGGLSSAQGPGVQRAPAIQHLRRQVRCLGPALVVQHKDANMRLPPLAWPCSCFLGVQALLQRRDEAGQRRPGVVHLVNHQDVLSGKPAGMAQAKVHWVLQIAAARAQPRDNASFRLPTAPGRTHCASSHLPTTGLYGFAASS